MSVDERKIAEKIWPQHMPQPDRYADRRQEAMQWLGRRYLLAQPVRKRA